MNACVCIAVWHTHRELFEALTGIPNLDIFIVSHRNQEELPEWIYEYVSTEKIFFERNYGYDWGAYQQFIRKGLFTNYTTIFFTHDDIRILNPDVFQVCAGMITEYNNNCFIGNGRVTQKMDWPRTHIHCYAHSSWKPPSWSFYHSVVRGSFMATSLQVLERIEQFEVFWDRHRYIGIGAGNWSLRATCGKIQALFGNDIFQFLSNDYLSSHYLLEYVRGQTNSKQITPPISWRIRNKLLVDISRSLMTCYMNSRSRSVRQRLDHIMQMIFAHL